MKTILVIINILMITTLGYSQINKIELSKKELIGQIAPAGYASIKCEKIDSSQIRFTYLDVKYEAIKEWKYFELNSLNDLEVLYQEIKKGFEHMPSEPIALDISNGYIILYYSRFLGGKVIRIAHSTSKNENTAIIGYTNLYTRKQIDKLFGKR